MCAQCKVCITSSSDRSVLELRHSKTHNPTRCCIEHSLRDYCVDEGLEPEEPKAAVGQFEDCYYYYYYYYYYSVLVQSH